jgi:alpha-tubulin suppressor-like RCC1 family protein
LGTNLGAALVAAPMDLSNLPGQNIAQVSAGFEHSLLLTEIGTVFATGSNSGGRAGLGLGVSGALIPTPIDASNMSGKTITQVSAAVRHNLLLANDGAVFAFGDNASGRTGLGTSSGSTFAASPINTSNLSGKTIAQVSAGGDHSLFLADDGTVFSCGFNSFGATGLGTTSGFTLVATPINTTNLSGKKIKQVSAGFNHSLLLADDGTVFSFGSNSSGQTGLGLSGGNTLTATPIDTSNLAGKKVKQVAAGNVYSLLLTEDGSVFAFGFNGFGRTGLGMNFSDTLAATPIVTTNLAGKTITQIAAGEHSLILASDGTVFSFGSNDSGRTGLGTDVGMTLIATPIDTMNFAGLLATSVSAGGQHSLFTAIPEPSAATILASSLALLAIRRRLNR